MQLKSVSDVVTAVLQRFCQPRIDAILTPPNQLPKSRCFSLRASKNSPSYNNLLLRNIKLVKSKHPTQMMSR